MRRVYIFGAGSTGQDLYKKIKDSNQVVGFLDSDSKKWGKSIDGVPITGGSDLVGDLEYDVIIIASLPGLHDIYADLLQKGVNPVKIDTSYIQTQVEARLNFIRDFAKINKNNISTHSVAEGGVFQGEFAKEINACFPEIGRAHV